MIVHKFGGTSVGSAERFADVAAIITDYYRRTIEGKRPGTVVIVSAMSGTTDELIAGARAAVEGKDGDYRQIKASLLAKHVQAAEAQLNHSPQRVELCGLIEDRLHELERLYRSIAVLGELTPRGSDVVASFGEQLSAHILAATLREQGVRAQAVSATQLIVTDDHFGAAVPLMEPTRQRLQQQVRPLLERGVVPVITGYIAATERGATTTLGRGGSDYSAALVGAGLDADEVWIWSDVDGILTADPNIVPAARTLDELSYGEAADLAYFGAEVLHPKTIRPLVEARIPLRILNSFNPTHPGTRIVETPGPARQRLPAIISSSGFSLIAVVGQNSSWTLYTPARILQRLSEAGLEVLLFWQSLAEHSLNLMVRAPDQNHCLRILHEELQNGRQGAELSLETKERVATLSVVGVPGWERNGTGIVSQAFAALGKHNTRIIAVAQAATEFSVSFCVPEAEMADAVRFMHRELGLEN